MLLSESIEPIFVQVKPLLINLLDQIIDNDFAHKNKKEQATRYKNFINSLTSFPPESCEEIRSWHQTKVYVENAKRLQESAAPLALHEVKQVINKRIRMETGTAIVATETEAREESLMERSADNEMNVRNDAEEKTEAFDADFTDEIYDKNKTDFGDFGVNRATVGIELNLENNYEPPKELEGELIINGFDVLDHFEKFRNRPNRSEFWWVLLKKIADFPELSAADLVKETCRSFVHVEDNWTGREILQSILAFAERFSREKGYNDVHEAAFTHDYIKRLVSSPFRADDENYRSYWREDMLDATVWRKNLVREKISETVFMGHKVDGILRDPVSRWELLLSELSKPDETSIKKKEEDGFKIGRALRDVFCHTAFKVLKHHNVYIPKNRFAVMGIHGFQCTLEIKVLIYRFGLFWLVPIPLGTLKIPKSEQTLKYLDDDFNVIHFCVKRHVENQLNLLREIEDGKYQTDDAESLNSDDTRFEKAINTRTLQTPKKSNKRKNETDAEEV
ncbi:hypothetical protein HK098_006179 [Nowakowskiella sp. JEL0407]|nr:hypothetical protein HK098_006179 [Nowakowskiella sp. JEL0407]